MVDPRAETARFGHGELGRGDDRDAVVVESFFGALILQSRRPFTIGDTVELGDHVGVVKDIDSRTVVLREFATSSIDLDVYYWHASDVPAELVATNDVMLAIHQAFAEEDITNAFPQMVVWPGRSVDDAPYPEPTDGEVYTEHPAVPGGRERSADRSSGGWRPWRRN